MASWWQENSIRLLHGGAHQGATHGPAIHPVILPLSCGAVECRRTHGTVDEEVQTLPGDGQHLRRQFLAKDYRQALPQVGTRWGEQQPPAVVLHVPRHL